MQGNREKIDRNASTRRESADGAIQDEVVALPKPEDWSAADAVSQPVEVSRAMFSRPQIRNDATTHYTARGVMSLRRCEYALSCSY